MADFSVEVLKQRLRGQRDAAAGLPLAEARAGLDSFGAKARLPPQIAVSQTRLADRNAEWLTPCDAPKDRAVLYIHGGGFVAGSCASHRQLASEIAAASNTQTVALDYSLAPENPWPTAEREAASAYRELLESFARVAVVGDSAGGHIAIGATLRARDEGKPLPAAIVLMSPWIDLDMTGGSVLARASVDPVLREDRLRSYAALYRNGGREKSLLEADLAGFPPTLIHAGGDEILMDDALRFARRLERYGVETVCDIRPGLFHVWHAYTPWLAEAREAVTTIGAFLGQKLGRS
jgi:acetyl esterase/lipase